MIPLAADENFESKVVRGVIRRRPDLEFVRVQDAGLLGAGDPAVLDWAARAGYVLLTHDFSSMKRFAYERVDSGLPMPGVFQVGQHQPIAQLIEAVLLLAECSFEGEWEGQVRYLPL